MTATTAGEWGQEISSIHMNYAGVPKRFELYSGLDVPDWESPDTLPQSQLQIEESRRPIRKRKLIRKFEGRLMYLDEHSAIIRLNEDGIEREYPRNAMQKAGIIIPNQPFELLVYDENNGSISIELVPLRHADEANIVRQCIIDFSTLKVSDAPSHDG